MADRSLSLFLLAGALALTSFGCPDGDDDGTTDAGTDAGVDAGEDSGVDSGVDTGVDSGTPDMGQPDSGDDPQAINFIHTNDEQSQHLGWSPNIDDWPTLSNDERIKGGVFRRARTIERMRAAAQTRGEPSVVANGGDLSMGTLFHVANLTAPSPDGASPDYVIMTQLGYNVGTIGNHEFDFGPDILAAMILKGNLDPINQTFSVLRIPLVVSNIRFSMSSPSDDALAALWSESGATGRPIVRYSIQEFDGVRVGFVGYMGLDAALVAPFKSPVSFSLAVDPQSSCSNDSQCPGSICIPPASDPTAATGNCALDPSGANAAVNFPALVADVAGAVNEVRSRNVDIVVAVSHAGVGEDELVAESVAAVLDPVPAIDLIIGGHSHTALLTPVEVPNPNGRTTYIVQAGGNGQYVGRIRLSRPNRSAAWTMDPEETELVEMNGTVTTTGLGTVTQLVLETLINEVTRGLESNPAASAGDGALFPGEQCDGTILPNNGNCVGLPGLVGATGGSIACEANRQVDLSGCQGSFSGPNCGNNTVEGDEQCDGTMIPIQCTDLGYDGGTMGCNTNCTLDFEQCTPHFPSLLEIALNFQRGDRPEIRDDPNVLFDLAFYVLGRADFDVGNTIPSNESNLSNLVADSIRWSINTLDDDAIGEPVEIAIVANGVIRDGLFMGMTGDLSFSDLFRVLPLGISPQERTPLYSLVDFWLSVPEVKAGLEVGLSTGLESDSFWLGISGARVFYDLSLPEFDPANPLMTGRITRIELINPNAAADPWDDTNATYESTPLFDVTATPPFDPNRYVHVATNLYVSLFMGGFGLCPRIDPSGVQFGGCRQCTADTDCTVQGSTCNQTAGRCEGGPPAGFFLRTQVPIGNGFFQELKELLGFTTYIRNLPVPKGGKLPTIPGAYNEPTPRRMCCVGAACGTGRSCP